MVYKLLYKPMETCNPPTMTLVMQPENSSGQSVTDQRDTLVYADIGPSSVKRAKHAVTLRPDVTDDRVEYALLKHGLQKPVIQANEDSIAGII